jgi:pantothenate kinase-related protein Tda10
MLRDGPIETRIPLAVLKQRATYMEQGYYEVCLSKGRVEGDELVLTHEAYEEMAARYTMRLQNRGCPGCGG